MTKVKVDKCSWKERAGARREPDGWRCNSYACHLCTAGVLGSGQGTEGGAEGNEN